MNYLISKELLSEVLGHKIWKILNCNIGTLRYCIYPNKRDEPSEYTFPINIHELAYKCKEWALNKGYRLLSGFDEKEYENSPDIEYSCIVNHIYCEGGCRSDNNFNSYSEPEAIFKACQWILDNKD